MKLFDVSFWGVYSVWRRHAYVYKSTLFTNCLPPLTEPLIYLFAFGLGLSPLISSFEYNGQQITYLEFVAPGMIAVGVLFQAFFEGCYGTYIRLRYQRTWHALLAAPLSFSEIFVGDVLWAGTKGLIAGALTGAVAVCWGVYPVSAFISVIPLLCVSGILFGAFGVLVAGVVRTIDEINVPVFLFAVPSFVLCGTYFPRDNLPPVLKAIADFLPLSFVVDFLRLHIALPQAPTRELILLAIWTVAVLLLGWDRLCRRIFGCSALRYRWS